MYNFLLFQPKTIIFGKRWRRIGLVIVGGPLLLNLIKNILENWNLKQLE